MTLYHTPKTFCTADQLHFTPSEDKYGRARADGERQRLVDFCKALTGIYPDIKFYAQGWDSPEIGREIGEVGSRVYAFRSGVKVAQIDVDYTGGDFRYTVIGKHVEGSDRGYGLDRGEQKCWRKDATKLLGLIASKDFFRFDNPAELYQNAKHEAEASASSELWGLNNEAEELERRARDEAIALALGAPPSVELNDLLAKVSEWAVKVDAIAASLKLKNEKLAAQYGVTPHAVGALRHGSALQRVVDTYRARRNG